MVNLKIPCRISKLENRNLGLSQKYTISLNSFFPILNQKEMLFVNISRRCVWAVFLIITFCSASFWYKLMKQVVGLITLDYIKNQFVSKSTYVQGLLMIVSSRKS